jgi:hydrogenase nickel insertion protein HypA
VHETTLAKRILAVVLERAAGRSVTVVRGRIAEDELLSSEALELHFRAHARDTNAAHARLELELHRLSARCKSCSARFLPDHHVRLCPECGSTDAELEGDSGVRIESIEVGA